MRGWREGAAALAGRMSRCAVHLHSLFREHNLGLKSLNQYYPSPRPLTP